MQTDPTPDQYVEAPEQPIPLWNPNATVAWSTIFTPAFGSYLQAQNWRTLGEHEKEKTAKLWFYASIAMLGIYILIVYMYGNPYGIIPGNNESIIPENETVFLIALIYFFVWFCAEGISHIGYVNEKFRLKESYRLRRNYLRLSWKNPLLVGVFAVFCYWILTVFTLMLLMR